MSQRIVIALFLISLYTANSTTAQNFWEQTNGPYGGDTNALIVNTNGDIFAGTFSGGVFRSGDNGSTWEPVNSGLTNLQVSALAINANGDIFAGTFDGVFRSTNNGDAWVEVSSGLTITDVRALAINANGDIFAGTFGGGIFRSTNNGETWDDVNSGLTNTNVLALAINTDGNTFAGTFDGVFRSTDNGNTWEPVNAGLTNTAVEALAVNANADIFAGTFGGGVFRSTNNGDTWEAVNTGLTNTAVEALAVNANADIFAGTLGGGVFRSTNNGDTWEAVNTGLTNTAVEALAVNANADIFAGTSDFGGGVFRSTDNGETWEPVNSGLTGDVVFALAINTTADIFAGTIGGGVFRSTDNGDSWEEVKTGLAGNPVFALAINGNADIFAGTLGGVFRSTDNGDSWEPVNSGLTNNLVSTLAINADGDIFAGTLAGTIDSRIFRSTNNGDTWEEVVRFVGSGSVFKSGKLVLNTERDIGTRIDFPSGVTNDVLAIAINGNADIFAGMLGGVSRSTDNGDTWDPVNSGLTNTNVQALAINADADIFAGTDGGGFRSTNNGESWEAVNSGLTNTDVVALAINVNAEIFAGTDGGDVFRSADNGNTWVPENSGLTSSGVFAFAINANGEIFAGSRSGGVFRSVPVPGGQPADSLIASYSFSGNANDESGNGNHGTLLGGATVDGRLVIGDNAEDALSIPNTAIDGLTDFTFSARLKINTLHAGGGLSGHAWVHGARSGNTNSFGFFYYPSSNEWEVFGDPGTIFFNDSSIEDGQFHQVTVVRQGALVRMFIDGNEVESAKTFGDDAIAVDPEGFIIGQEEDAVGGSFSQNQSWAGEIDDFKIFNKALVQEPTGDIVVQSPGDQRTDTNADITVTPPPGFQPTTNELFFRRGGETAYQMSDLTAAGNDLSGTIPANFVTIRGVEYYVSLSDGFSTVTFPNTDPVTNPAFLPVTVAQLDFQSTLSPQTHRMISVPLDLASTDIESVLMDDYGEYDVLPRQWRIFRFENGGYEEFPDITAEFTPGNAFWLITRSGDPFDIENAQSLDPSQPVSIVLPPNDWSQIASPFSFSVDWNAVGNNARVQTPLFFDGTGYIPQTILQPFEGYFVFNPNPNPVTLTFQPMEAQQSPTVQDDTGFVLNISAKVNGTQLQDAHNFLGLKKAAEEHTDALDLLKPPALSKEVQVDIVHKDRAFTRNFKPVNSKGQEWDLEITSSLPEASVAVTLEERGKLPSAFDIFIFDLDRLEPVKAHDHRFTLDVNSDSSRRLKIMIGTTEFAEANDEDIPLQPTEFNLEQNYPNPFNPETTIQYSVDKPGEIRLEIFNLLGQKIRTLVSERRTPGSYHQVWDGKNDRGIQMPSGVYVYRLTTNANVATRKLILIR